MICWTIIAAIVRKDQYRYSEEQQRSCGISWGDKRKQIDGVIKITTLAKRRVNDNDNYSSDESTPTAVVVDDSRYYTGVMHSIDY